MSQSAEEQSAPVENRLQTLVYFNILTFPVDSIEDRCVPLTRTVIGRMRSFVIEIMAR